MRAITIINPGPDFRLEAAERPIPSPHAGQVRIRVSHAGVNRPDLLHAQGKYAVPADASDLPGLEVSGTIDRTGNDVTEWKGGEAVCALTHGGGYADYVCVDARHVLPKPERLSFAETAALPETVLTVWQNMFRLGAFNAGASVLIHGGSSGIGTTAIQIAKARGASFIATTVRSDAAATLCAKLGADQVINTERQDYTNVTVHQPVDIVLDMMGGDYFEANLRALAPFGRHISIATLRGAAPALPIRLVMQKNLTLTGSTLRPQTVDVKADLVAAVRTQIWPLIEAGQITPILDQILPLTQAQNALKRLEEGGVLGKIVLAL